MTNYRSFLRSDREAVLALIERVWRSDTRRLRAFLWDWLLHPMEPTENPSQIAENDGHIVGYSGSMVRTFKFGDEDISGQVIVDSCSDPQHRGVGIRLLKAQVRSRPLSVGMPIARVRRLWHRLLRQDRLELLATRRRLYLLDPSAHPRIAGLPHWVRSLIASLWRIYGLVRAPRPAATPETFKVSRFSPAIDGVCETFARDFHGIGKRTHEWLNHRFCSPCIRYQKRVVIKDRRVQGYIVYRLGRLHGRRVALIIECLAIGEQQANYLALLDAVHREMARWRVCDIQTMETGCTAWSKALDRLGYRARNDDLSVIGFADTRSTQGAWYFTLGDGDFEFSVFKQNLGDLQPSCLEP